jgi:hypothetical protein
MTARVHGTFFLDCLMPVVDKTRLMLIFPTGYL